MENRSRLFFGVAASLLIILASCQTTKQVKALVPAAPSTIGTEALGFSPRAEAGHNTIDFALTLGNPEAVKGWKVEIKSDKGVQKTFSGAGSKAPASLSWDGKSEQGSLAPEGAYTASLSVDYASTYESSLATSSNFVLDITPPSGKIVVTTADLVPAGHGFASPASIVIDASSGVAKIASWSLDLLDPSGKVFRSFSDKWPQNVASWDGLSSGGAQAAPATTYKATAKVSDEFGNVGSILADVPVGDLPSASGATFIEAPNAGFAPKGESMIKTMDFTVGIGQKEALKTWKIEIGQAGAGPQKTLSGDSTNIPASFSWDGTSDGGGLAPEGVYTASLSVDYGAAFKAITIKSKSFVLDLTPPSGTVVSKPAKLTPDGKGGITPMTFTIVANSDIAALDSWSLSVEAADGGAVVSTEAKFPQKDFAWDGKVSGGALVDPSKPYTLVARVKDVFGNVGTLSGSLGLAEIPAVTAAVSITPERGGFSPNGDTAMDTIEFALTYGQPQAVKTWKVDILKSAQVVRSFSGDAASLPPTLSWDGKKADGKLADEGSYSATLAVDYGTVFKPVTAKSDPFILDLSVPTGSISLSQALFSPIESNPTLTIAVDATSPIAKMDSWSMKIYDPAGNLFKSFEGKWPNTQAVWDGKGISGDLVESAEDYAVAATVRDEFGNSAVLKTTIPVDILVEKTPTGYRILSSRIFFKAFTADYAHVAPDLAKQNTARLDQLATKLKKFPGYKITLVGHAVMINWENPARGKEEQEDILIPLSKARADAIKKAMVDRGFDPAMIGTQGVGASDQLVPDSDLVDRWRNRRVAFFLDKP